MVFGSKGDINVIVIFWKYEGKIILLSSKENKNYRW